MLQAIISNKSGRIEVNGEKVSLWELYKEREDMLTAAVISRLGYFSDVALQEIMQSIFPLSSQDFNQLKKLEFWPRFSSSFQQYVEPDVICHFSWGIIVIEAKRPIADGGQYAEQWHRELEALPGEYRKGDIYFLALGGSPTNYKVEKERFDELLLEPSNEITAPTLMGHLSWDKLAKDLIQIAKNNTWSSSDLRILHDILAALDLYDVNTNSFSLASLNSHHLAISNLSFDCFKNISTMKAAAIPLKEIGIQWNNAVNIFNQLACNKGV